ncbi:RICIN domain-containing protein [Streptomyces chrestomyceticus]|uniref:RICIN domain-containing protein n=2 Tax=Streptomyces chrestomyceticus TaxID=68185 RepID=A0ABU7WPK3_9ACTN
MSKRTVLSGLAAALGASAMLLTGMSGSASAADAPRYAWQIKNVQTGLCLDSDYQGNAYTKSCGNDNPYQQWSMFGNDDEGYDIKSQKTGRCLETVGYGDAVRTAPCSPDSPASQQWKQEVLGGQRVIYKNVANGRALDSNQKGQLYTSPYGTGNLYMQWWEW